ncbi:13320_t:CDS:2 [Entrophospora sp. SA101]|nr:13320_t:CDS:2 [Entrophospora sp. SA101]
MTGTSEEVVTLLPLPPSSSRHHSYTSSHRQRHSSLSPVLSTKIMVNKLTKNVKEAHLQEIFGAFGRINRIEVLIDEKLKPTKPNFSKLSFLGS